MVALEEVISVSELKTGVVCEFRYEVTAKGISASSLWAEEALTKLSRQLSKTVVCCATCKHFRLSSSGGEDGRFSGWCMRDSPTIGVLWDVDQFEIYDREGISCTPAIHWCDRWSEMA
jgi:hypothetical protein